MQPFSFPVHCTGSIYTFHHTKICEQTSIVRGHIPSTPCLFRYEKRGQMKASPKGNFHRFFSPLHSHQKALPFGNPRRATLPFLILRQQDSVFLDYLPDGQPSGLLVTLHSFMKNHIGIIRKSLFHNTEFHQ